jgi:protein gp37
LGETTGIQWTDHTFNPWWGCEKVSPACDHCYAESLAKRYGHGVWGHDAPRRFFGVKHWAEPLKWNREAEKAGVRRRVFCASMADVFEDRADLLDTRAELWALILDTPQLDWQLLTKRPANVTRLIPLAWRVQFPPNVWIGTTAETQGWLDIRARWMTKINPRVLFISYEPALGLITVPLWAQWVIAGGESGSGCRAIDPEWVRSVRDQCIKAGVPFFFKQWGGFHPKANGAVLDGREWKQFPDIL